MTRLRLIADDLTGALDTAAQFVGRAGPVPVFWRMPAALPPSAALDSGTREQDAARAAAVATETASLLQPRPARSPSRRSTACCGAIPGWNWPTASAPCPA